MRDKVLAVLDLYEEGATIHAARTAIGISGKAFYAALRSDQSLASRYDDAHKSRSDGLVSEALDISTDRSLEPAQMRVMAQIRLDVAKMLDRQRFGDRLDLRVEAGPSLSQAISEAVARRRQPALPPRDLEPVIEGDFIALPAPYESKATDKQSVDHDHRTISVALKHSDVFDS